MAQQAEISSEQAVSTASVKESRATAGTAVPLESPSTDPAVSTSTDTKQEPGTGTPAKTKSTITALLIIGGVVTGIVLALMGGGKKPTIISAGTPRVSTPTNP
jgi:hypothetical protein